MRHIKINLASPQPTEEIFPIVQNMTCSIVSVFRIIIREISEAKKKLIDTPDRSNTSVEILPLLDAIQYAIIVAKTEPIKAKIVIAVNPIKDELIPKNDIAIAAPRAAPDELPNIYGSAI